MRTGKRDESAEGEAALSLRGTTRNKRVVNERAETPRCEEELGAREEEREIYLLFRSARASSGPEVYAAKRGTYKTNEDNKSAYDD